MPYEVLDNADGCDGFAVVKVGSSTPIDGGCHRTEQDAKDHAAALNIATADERDSDYEDEHEEIIQALGKFSHSQVGYKGESPLTDYGWVCSQCSFYVEGGACRLVEGEIAEQGICRLWHRIEQEEPEEPEDDAEEEDRAISLSAPSYMRRAAQRGLRMYEEGHGGDGLVSATISAARKMARGEVSIEKWRKIGPWIARHMVDLDAPKNTNPNHPDYPGAGLVAHLLWGSGPSKADAERAMNYAVRLVKRYEADERAGPASTPAPKKDQVFGSDKNKPGSAKGEAGPSTITLNDAVEKSLQNKAATHNDKMKKNDKPAWTRVTVGALRSVYRRGAGAFSTSHRPGMTRGQWAMGRVNAFLYLAENGRPENVKYVADNDLLNKEHPKYSKGS